MGRIMYPREVEAEAEEEEESGQGAQQAFLLFPALAIATNFTLFDLFDRRFDSFTP
jgi:hypothetical protein